jgi:signal transduction histidine kinase
VNAEAGALLVAGTSGDSSEVREIFHSIVADDMRAVEVIESVRKLLRKDKPVVTTVDLNEICCEAIHLLQHDALRRKTRLELRLSASRPMVTGDPIQLQQVVLNLALNGLEAASTSTAGRFVVVQTDCTAEHVDVLVHDSGPGIPSTVRPHLFESFFSTKSGGLGLGLVIVRSIVERHGGRIYAENNSLGGTLMRVRLPLARGDDRARAPLTIPRLAGDRTRVPTQRRA